jgi:hypothetical protein
MERRAADLDARHELELRELGRLALEMHRGGRIDGPLLMERAGELAEIERELGEARVALESAGASAQPSTGQ